MRAMRKLTLAAVLAAAVGVLSAGPAFASSSAAIPIGVVAQGEFTGVVKGGGNQFVYTCTAHGVGDVVSVSIERCQMVTNHPLALPGVTSVSAGTDFIPFGGTVQLCWAASAVFTDTTIRRATSACTGAGIGGLAGAGFSSDLR
jgi:hypothetical protein